MFNDWWSDEKNQSPALSWENAPEGTKSFAITVYNTDAPARSGWWHWLIFDINVNRIEENTGNPELKLAPQNAIQSVNNYGTKRYGDPCPSEGHGPH